MLIPHLSRVRLAFIVFLLALGSPVLPLARSAPASLPAAVPPSDPRPAGEALKLAKQAEIRRTEHGVVHIRGENLRAASFALAYAQIEDYGDRVIRGLVEARGELALIDGRRRLASDARNRERYTRAVETWHRLPSDVRDVYEGFAEGANHYIRTNPDDVPAWAKPVFTGHDVAARDIGWYSSSAASRFVRNLERRGADAVTVFPEEPEPNPEDGSNAFALAPERTKSGHAILMRNPHLSWTAGYYEAHVTVPGKLNFYGDFRIGGPFGIIGGFNENLGWSTTNNDARVYEIYALALDPEHPDHFRFDGVLTPISRREITLRYRHGSEVRQETRESLHTPLGPVIHRDDERLYIIRAANQGEFRLGEQFLRMMQAKNHEEWLAAMKLRARHVSNFTYADGDGNIYYVWNAALPKLPHKQGNDETAFFADGSEDIWTELVPFEKLPQLLNPEGGYVRNENDSPHFTNLNEVMRPEELAPNVQSIRLRLRSQHGLQLLHNDKRFSLEEAVELKHSMRMLLADRIKEDLVAAVRRSRPSDEVAAAADLLERWDNTGARESRGAVLFAAWWNLYEDAVRTSERFRRPWTADEPTATPRGLGKPDAAVAAFERAVEEVRDTFGSWDVAWGDVHRVRRGEVDVPVGGGSGNLGFYRVLTFREDDDGKRRVNGGDCWVLAVEFSDPPRAYSVLAYGQSSRGDSPFHSDQAEMFAANRMKEVAFTEKQIQEKLIRRYRPGERDNSLTAAKEGGAGE